MARDQEDKWFTATVLTCLGVLAECENDLIAQQRYHQEALLIHRQIGNHLGIVTTHHNLSLVYTQQQDFPAAYASLAESLTLLQQVGDRRVSVNALSHLAGLEKLQGRTESAVRLLGTVQRILEETGAAANAFFQSILEEVQSLLNEEVFVSALAQGRAMNTEQAFAHALSVIQAASLSP